MNKNKKEKDANIKNEVSLFCPILKRSCLRDLCAWWCIYEKSSDCAISDIAYTLTALNENYITTSMTSKDC